MKIEIKLHLAYIDQRATRKLVFNSLATNSLEALVLLEVCFCQCPSKWMLLPHLALL